ncbi:MAG TPA: LiaF domain-containing protein [Longimicrobiales bacterium]|nr:LiaF domain-containing protein [Longimicrobiales bacterium]
MTNLGTRSSLSLALLLALVVPAGARGQEWENVSASRKLSGEDAVDVRIKYGVGRFQVRPGDPGTLYRMDLRYDSERFEPVVDYSRGRLELGVETRGRNLNFKGDNDGGEMTLELSPAVPMDLVLEFGAVRANLDLGGLHLTDLELSTGASESSVDFSRPTLGRVRTAEFHVGAADFEALNLGNLRADRLEVEAGVGEVTLDFGGELPQDMRVTVSMGLGALELRVPDGVGVSLEKDSFLTSLDASDFTQDGDMYYSSNWETAGRRLTVEVEAAFGSIRIVRVR